MTWPKKTYLPTTYLLTYLPILRHYCRQYCRLVTIETLITILTIGNLNSWQSLLPDNQEWQWTAFAIIAMFWSDMCLRMIDCQSALVKRPPEASHWQIHPLLLVAVELISCKNVGTFIEKPTGGNFNTNMRSVGSPRRPPSLLCLIHIGPTITIRSLWKLNRKENLQHSMLDFDLIALWGHAHI